MLILETMENAVLNAHHRITLALLMLFTTLAMTTCALAKPCSTPSPSVLEKANTYVMKSRHLEGAGSLTLKANAQANAACYWRLTYILPGTQRELTTYLTPDQNYLVSAIQDINSDPLEAEKQQQNELNRTLSISGSPVRGDGPSSVRVVEFSDFECPYCKRFADMLRQSGDTKSDISVTYKQFPLSMHPWAHEAAELTSCANMQGSKAFWLLHDYIFDNQKSLSLDNFKSTVFEYAKSQSEISIAALGKCLDSGVGKTEVSEDLALGQSLGVQGTPTIFINGIRVQGIRTPDELKAMIEAVKAGRDPRYATVVAKQGPAVPIPNRHQECPSPNNDSN